ncbi:MAG: AAA family ATPase [Bacteroidota bacterium]|nr:AAA family ATPase [Bacteroidota bacterium]
MDRFELPSTPNFVTYTSNYYEFIPQGYNTKVFAQIPIKDYPSLDDMVYLKNDFELTNKQIIPGTLKPYEMVRTKTGFMIYKEYFNGIPLEKFLQNREFGIPLFLQLAIRLTSLLKEIHNKKTIVKEFIIENILISPENLEMKICSLGSATLLSRERPKYSSDFILYGSLWHVAPEQTGRIGRTVDYRTDFYSLGVIFYQILCGRKPFNYSDSIELIHAHIAKNPIEPKIFNENIPAQLSDLVMKLMAKNAEDRYQSEDGILEDLETCVHEWQHNGNIGAFVLGQRDNSSIYSLSEKLYGRENEMELIQKTWKRIQQNRVELFLVTGYSGIGKTRLINEIRKPVLETNGYFISGKFDQLNKENPYSAFGMAFNNLIQILLSEPEDKIENWKQKLHTSLGDDAALLIEVIPELGRLIETHIEVIELGPIEGKKRFLNAFIQFLHTFENKERPLVIFIDDLQWADSGSLELINAICNSQLNQILLVGAYRNNEVDESHPLSVTLKVLEKEAAGRINSITLNELSSKDVNDLVSDTLHLNPKTTEDLTSLIMKKTRGNPFFIKQFMEKLIEERHIYYDSNVSSWIWNLSKISSLELTDYVVDLILIKLKKLSDPAQEIISLAACIGNTFELETLSTISKKSNSELAELLSETITAEFLYPVGQWVKYHHDEIFKTLNVQAKSNINYRFQFQHDRIQQAAYAIIPEADIKRTHLKIGQTLMTKMTNEEFDDNIFDILGHINIGRELINSKKELDELASLNLKAAKRALRNNAISPALNHFTTGMDIMTADQDSELFKDLLIGRSECEYLLGNFVASEELFDQAIFNAGTNLKKADIICRKMALYENTQRYEKALEASVQGLKLIGMHLPLNAGPLHVMKELLTVKFLLINKSTSDLLNNRNMVSPEKILMMKILMNLWGPLYLLQKQNLLAFKILRMVNLSIRYGNSKESALAYAFYGYVISAQLKDYKSGYDFAKLGMALNIKFNDKTLRSKVMVISEGCVAHWKMPFGSYLANLREGYSAGIDSNDIIYAGYAATFANRNHLFMGKELNEVYDKMKGYIQFALKIQSVVSLHQMMPWARLVCELSQIEKEAFMFGELIEDKDHFNFINTLAQAKLLLPMAQYYTAKSMYHYILADYNEALDFANKSDGLMESVLGLPEWAEQLNFEVLSSLAVLLGGKTLSRKQDKKWKKTFKLMKRWAEESPSNYESKYLLASAEFASLNKKHEEAKGLYEKAIISSQQSEMRYMTAIIYERLANHYFKLNDKFEAENYIHLALIEYQNWGAKTKVNILLQKFSFLFDTKRPGETITKGLSSTSLDLQSVLKAASILSGEIVEEKLLEKLLLIVIENAGAQNAYLIRNRMNKLYVDASSKMSDGFVCEVKSYPLEESKIISQAMVRKVFNTKEAIIVDDAQNDPRYIKDEQLNSSGKKSILCMPIQSKGQITAVLYLDNALSANTFTRNRLEILNLLSGQIAVSLDNAQMYQNLEQKVQERTSTIEKQKIELEAEKLKTDELLLNILPDEIAAELKTFGKSMPRRHESVAIMFTDFEKFTRMSEKLSPESIVEIVDHHYKAFDQIIEKHGIEKIKTMGDAYMCVSGLPKFNKNFAENAILAAIEIKEFVEKYNKERAANDLPFCQIRIGIHTGPVVAGVVGLRKFAYDIWGDAVNTASRMQSAGEPGKINISDTTYELIKDKFICEFRGKVKVKYKDDIDMYYVTERILSNNL